MNTSRGFASLGLILLLVIGLAILGGGGYYLTSNQAAPPQPVTENATSTQPAPQTNTSTNSTNPTNTASTTTQTTVTTTSSISVSGMSKYTDTDFGFSFWYPSGWTVTPASLDSNEVARLIKLSGAGAGAKTLKTLQISNGKDTIYLQEIESASGIQIFGQNNDSKIYFDGATHQWMEYNVPESKAGNPGATYTNEADISIETMGGLLVIWDAIIPLSKDRFIIVGPNYSDSRYWNKIPFIQTIVATDPTIATPVSTAEQIKIIQAAKDAYAGQ